MSFKQNNLKKVEEVLGNKIGLLCNFERGDLSILSVHVVVSLFNLKAQPEIKI